MRTIGLFVLLSAYLVISTSAFPQETETEDHQDPLSNRIVSDSGVLSKLKVRVAWNRKATGYIKTPFAYCDNIICYANAAGVFGALDVRDKMIKWKKIPTLMKDISIQKLGPSGSHPYIHNNVTYFVDGLGFFIACDLHTGKGRWGERLKERISNNQTNIAISENIACINGHRWKSLYAYNIKEKARVWKYNINEDSNGIFETLAIAASNGVIAFQRSTGYLIALDIETGKELWKFHSGFNYTEVLTVTNDLVLVGSCSKEPDKRHFLHAIDLHTGKLEWSFATNSRFSNKPVEQNGVLCFSDYTTVYAVDIETGHEKWKLKSEEKIYPSLAVNEQILCYRTWKKRYQSHLYIVDIKKGESLCKFPIDREGDYLPIIIEGNMIYMGHDGITALQYEH